MNQELCWMVLPITGILSQIGGTWFKWARRYVIPVVAAGMVWYFTGHFYWQLIPMMLGMYGAFCLPVTLKGDGIPEHWLNWLWLPLWGILICSGVLWLHLGYWLISLTFGLFLAILVALSNVPACAKFFQWKMVEFFEGVLPLIPLCYFITLQP